MVLSYRMPYNIRRAYISFMQIETILFVKMQANVTPNIFDARRNKLYAVQQQKKNRIEKKRECQKMNDSSNGRMIEKEMSWLKYIDVQGDTGGVSDLGYFDVLI